MTVSNGTLRVPSTYCQYRYYENNELDTNIYMCVCAYLFRFQSKYLNSNTSLFNVTSYDLDTSTYMYLHIGKTLDISISFF